MSRTVIPEGVPHPDTARYLRRSLEHQGPPIIGILAEDPSIRDLTRALEAAAQDVAAGGQVRA